MVQLVKQTLVSQTDFSSFAVCRWDNIKKVLMFQNKSKDFSLSLDDYLNRRQSTINGAVTQGLLISEIDVPIGSLWPTQKTVKHLFPIKAV